MSLHPITHLWIDESGDGGFKFTKGSSRYLVLAAVFMVEGEQEKVLLRIAQLRTKEINVTPDYEFKFSRCKHVWRELFLNTVADLPIQYKAIVVDKQHLSAPALQKQPRQLYAEAMKRLLYDNDPPLSGATLIIDEATAKVHEKEFSTLLRRYVSKNTVDKIKQHRSQSDSMIQIADMIAGSLFRKFEKSDGSYHELIKGRQKILIEF